MPQLFLQTLTSPSVERARQRYGSREAIARATASWDTAPDLGPDEVSFVESRDGFYLATTGEGGWPYVQYRGGPAGFLRVLSPTQVAWADVRGNRQYLSVGNIDATHKAALFLMDYPRRARLKIIGEARVIDAADDPDLVRRLSVPGLGGKVERAVVLDVVAHDWNCQQHITPRWTEAELASSLDTVRAHVETLEAEVRELRRQNADLRSRRQDDRDEPLHHGHREAGSGPGAAPDPLPQPPATGSVTADPASPPM